MDFIEYPKALYLRGWDDLAAVVTVQDAAGEAEARAGGYRALSDPVEAPAKVEAAGEPSKRDEVVAEMDKLGIAYDKRWGVDRMTAALESVTLASVAE